MRKTLTRFPWLVCEIDGLVAGYAYSSPHRDRAAYQWSADVSVYVRSDRHRSGVARALYTTLFEALDLLGYYKVYAGITLPNPPSIGLHKAFGFQEVGVYKGVGFKLGQWQDVAWFERTLRPPTPNPTPPKTFEIVRNTSEFADAVKMGESLLRPRVPDQSR
jgi:phosphinothricin acetyltransferase